MLTVRLYPLILNKNIYSMPLSANHRRINIAENALVTPYVATSLLTSPWNIIKIKISIFITPKAARLKTNNILTDFVRDN